MLSHCLGRLRNHFHAILIVPLVVIVMTWPVLPQLFNGDAFWLHTADGDAYHRIWDSWHIGQVLAGQADLWHTDDMFHPRGSSLVFQHFSFPHALLLLALKKVMPTDSAYNLLYLVILCFNGFSAYVLIQHLLKDKWAALFGAVALVLGVSSRHTNPVPDLICIGTLPLTLYFFHRACFENRRLFAALAGFCAGITAFIGMYTFVFILLSAAIYAAFLLPGRWRQWEFWRLLLVFALLCAAISALRIYPIIADADALQEGLARYATRERSFDFIGYFVHGHNPITWGLLRSAFDLPLIVDSDYATGYLGYINLFFLACALLLKKQRKSLLPWAAIFIFFAIMRLGDFLSFSGIDYREIVLPHRFLVETFPLPFGQIGDERFYHYGLITALALLASFGLTALLRGRSARTRALVSLAAILILAVEFYAPKPGLSLPNGATAYIDWLKTEKDDPIKLINLPRVDPFRRYAQYTQTLTGYPTAYGHVWRNLKSADKYVDRNWLLREWRQHRSGHCFGRRKIYLEALNELLSDGFTHIVLHRWANITEQVLHSFIDVPAAYDDGLVRIYRLRDMRQGCQNLPPALAAFEQFLESPWGTWELGSSLLSFHPREPIAEDRFAYLDDALVLTSDWGGALHLYVDQGEPRFQAAAGRQISAEDFTARDQVIYVVYHSRDATLALMESTPPLDQYQPCGRLAFDDGWAALRLLRREYACALLAANSPTRVEYENGIVLENRLFEYDRDWLELQFRWSGLPSDPHAISLQVFDAAGVKVLGQDLVIRLESLERLRIDISALAPGNYAVKLILYKFATGASVPGTISGSGERFQRALDLGQIVRD